MVSHLSLIRIGMKHVDAYQYLPSISKRLSEPVRAPFNSNLLSIDRSSNYPFIDPTPIHFREKNSDKKIKYHFESSTPSHSHPYMNRAGPVAYIFIYN
jgi:hypothetical protein